MEKNNISKILVILLVFSSIVLPSGSVYGLNIKLIIAISSLLLFLTYLLTDGVNRRFLYSFIGLFIFLTSYSLIALTNGVEDKDIISHGIAISSLFLVIAIPLFSISKRIIRHEELIRTIFISLAVFSTLKILMSLIIVTGTPAEQVQLIFESIFGVTFIGLDTGTFYRVHLTSDYLLPIAIYLLLQKNINHYPLAKTKKKIYILIFTLAIIISYSRLLYAYTAVAAIFAFALSKQNNKTITASFFALPILLIYFLSSQDNILVGFITERYSGEFAQSSDGGRTRMLNALLQTFEGNIFFGRGLGAGTPNYINIENVPWYFELQWLSFAMQFGIFGFLIILSISLYPALKLLRKSISKHQISLLGLYIFWLVVGIFNGFMLTSAGGAIFLFFIISFWSSTQTTKYNQLQHDEH